MCENNTNFYHLKDGRFSTFELCTISTAIVVSIVDMYNKKIRENYIPQLGDIIMEVIYQDNIKSNKVNVYKVEVISMLNDGSKVLQLKPGATKALCDDNEFMIIVNMLKTKAISLYTKTKSDTYYKSTTAYNKLPEDFADTSCGCLNERTDRCSTSLEEGMIENVVGSTYETL